MYDGTAHSLLTTLRPEAVQVKKKLVKKQFRPFCFLKMVAAKSFIILFLAAAYIQGAIAGKCYFVFIPEGIDSSFKFKLLSWRWVTISAEEIHDQN